MTMGDRIRKRRQELGLSQQALAARVGVSRVTINELENRIRSTITTDTAKGLARALGVSIDYLVGTWEDMRTEEHQVFRFPAP